MTVMRKIKVDWRRVQHSKPIYTVQLLYALKLVLCLHNFCGSYVSIGERVRFDILPGNL